MRSIPGFLFALLIVTSGLPAAADGLAHARAAAEAEKSGNRVEALRLYTLALEAGGLDNAQLIYVYYRRGAVRGYLGHNEPAIEDFTNAILRNPSHGNALSLRGYLRGIVGLYDLAESDHRLAEEMAPTQGREAYLAWVLQHFADLRRRQRRFDEALELIDRSLKQKESPDTYFRRAWIYLDMERLDLARQDFKRFEDAARRDARAIAYWPDERAAIERLRALAERQ